MQQIIVDFGTFDFLGLQIPLRIFGYGLAMVLGFMTGIYMAQLRAQRAGESPEPIGYCGLLALVGGIIGARIAYVVENYRYFFPEHGGASSGLAEMLNITSGGLIYYGGVALATILVLAFLWAKQLPIRRFIDIVAPSLMIGLAFGRLGCLLNGCCYGSLCRPDWPLAMRFPMYSKPLVKLDGRDNPYSLSTEAPSPAFASQLKNHVIKPGPWLTYDTGNLIPPHNFTPEQVHIAESMRSQPVKPAQLLGILNGLVLAAILLAFGRLRRREGQVFALLAILYPTTRFLEELIRADNTHNVARGILTHNQYTSIILTMVGIVFWLILYRVPASAGPTLAGRLAAIGGPQGLAPQGNQKRKRDKRN